MKPLLLVIMSLFVYCKSDKSDQRTIQYQVESFFKSHGHSTAFNFVAITDPDTVTAKDYLDKEIEILTLSLMNKAYRLQKLDSMEAVTKRELNQKPDDQNVIINLRDIRNSKNLLHKQQHTLDSLNAAIKPELNQMVKFIGVTYSFSSTDTAGHKAIHNYYVKLDESLNVINATELKK